MAEVLRLQSDVPETIALAFVSGLPIESKFDGDEMMFSLTDERKLFVPPTVAKKIAASGLAAAGAVSAVQARDRTRQPARGRVPGRAHFGRGSRPCCCSGSTKYYSRHTADRGFRCACACCGCVPAAAPAPLTLTGTMMAAGKAAIDAVLEIGAYAQRQGMTDFSFGAENLQKIMVTLYIDARKGGRA